MSVAPGLAVGVLLAWRAGVRAYLTVFGVGLAGALGWLDLPPALEATTSPWVLGVSGVLALVEFGADKIPGVDSAWDLLQTLPGCRQEPSLPQPPCRPTATWAPACLRPAPAWP